MKPFLFLVRRQQPNGRFRVLCFKNMIFEQYVTIFQSIPFAFTLKDWSSSNSPGNNHACRWLVHHSPPMNLLFSCHTTLFRKQTWWVFDIALFRSNSSDTTLPGVLISSLSLSFMFILWWVMVSENSSHDYLFLYFRRLKQKYANLLNSSTLYMDSQCSLG